jgi:hypothetical protein
VKERKMRITANQMDEGAGLFDDDFNKGAGEDIMDKLQME